VRNRAIPLLFYSPEPLFVKKYEHRTDSKLQMCAYLLFFPNKDLIENRDAFVNIAV